MCMYMYLCIYLCVLVCMCTYINIRKYFVARMLKWHKHSLPVLACRGSALVSLLAACKIPVQLEAHSALIGETASAPTEGPAGAMISDHYSPPSPAGLSCPPRALPASWPPALPRRPLLTAADTSAPWTYPRVLRPHVCRPATEGWPFYPFSSDMSADNSSPAKQQPS